jgi:hypothetical protein
MHETADALERSEATLHDSAEKSMDEATTRRLHALGDAVTREAKAIDRRADVIGPRTETSDGRNSGQRRRGR